MISSEKAPRYFLSRLFTMFPEAKAYPSQSYDSQPWPLPSFEVCLPPHLHHSQMLQAYMGRSPIIWGIVSTGKALRFQLPPHRNQLLEQQPFGREGS